ncbi:MAG: hypothetical protein ACREEM_13030 [Blastocatellia bacterium]
MLGTILIRLLLVLAVIWTAHLFRPFSVKNVTQHLLYSTRSFAFVLPAQARTNFSQASNLALNLSNSLFFFEARQSVGGDEGLLLAMQPSQESLQPALKIWPPDETAKPCRKPKPAPKRSAPAKRIERTERNEVAIADVAVDAPVAADEPAAAPAIEEVAAPPVALPAAYTSQPGAAGLHTFSLGFLFTTEQKICSEQELKLLKLGTEIEVLKRPRVILLRAEKPRTAAPECEGESPDSGEKEPEIVAPVEEAPAPEAPEPPAMEEAPSEERPSPLKCPTQP